MRVLVFDSDSDMRKEMEEQPFSTESELESLVHQNPDSLLDEEIAIIARQPGTRAGSPDLIALDQYANTVIFELKKGKSGTGSASEKTILGQPQTYAGAFSSFSHTELNDMYQSYLSEIKDGKWDDETRGNLPSSLSELYEQSFSRSLEADEYNINQRMVIVAEAITRRTARNVRYNLNEGMNMQCVEAKRMWSPEDELTFLSCYTVVDYPLQRIKPKRSAEGDYQDLLEEIKEKVLANLSEVDFPIPNDRVTKNPRNELTFDDESLYQETNVGYWVRPELNGGYVSVRVRLNTWREVDEDKQEVMNNIRENLDFSDSRFSFSGESREPVTQEIPVSMQQGQLSDDSKEEIIEEITRLIHKVHPVLWQELR